MTVFGLHQKCSDFIPNFTSSKITFFIQQVTTAACNSNLHTVRAFPWLGLDRIYS